IIPIRLDSIIRLENVLLTIDNLLSNFETNIFLLEAAPYCNNLLKNMFRKGEINYTFIEDNDPVFYKTKYLNIMARQVSTKNVGIWDADVIINPVQIVEAVSLLRENMFDIVYPYDGAFLDTSEILRAYYLIHKDIHFLMKNREKMKSLYSIKNVIGALGGGILAKTEKYISAGGENELFYGWGLEDGERHHRWSGFGYKIHRINGPMFHLTHPRDLNGKMRSIYHFGKASSDWSETVHSTIDELRRYYSNLYNH
ncbi:hypothetical protein LJC57_01480, partial [Parabacteroides sp. OttesenSCG-928-G07]|nr:hypothetical protein [Parabacteroides sp. OttesenSCG-928-G07]